MFGMESGSWMPGGGLVMLLWWLVPVAVAVAAAVVIRLFSRTGTHATGSPAIDILRQRYARGEIGSEEFGRCKREL